MNSAMIPLAARGLTLRGVLRADALLCGVCGVVLTVLAGPLGDLLELPVTLLRVAGLVLLPVAALIASVGTRERVPRAAVRAIVALNFTWVAASLVLLFSAWVNPNALGIAFLLAQALLVLAFVAAELWAMRE